tara:strand:+ start:439 stop:717 length:279 start_codon:yes stop_codon:yes gene_type:complete
MTYAEYLEEVGSEPKTKTEEVLLNACKSVCYYRTRDGVAYEVDLSPWGDITNDGRGGGSWFRPSMKFLNLYPDKSHEIDEMACERIINAYEK